MTITESLRRRIVAGVVTTVASVSLLLVASPAPAHAGVADCKATSVAPIRFCF